VAAAPNNNITLVDGLSTVVDADIGGGMSSSVGTFL